MLINNPVLIVIITDADILILQSVPFLDNYQ